MRARLRSAAARTGRALAPLLSGPLARVLAVAALALTVSALWLWPLGGFLLTAVVPGLLHGRFMPSVRPLAQALSGGALAALGNSLLVAVLAALLALPVGTWLAWLRVRTRLPWRGWIEPAVWLLLVMPAYLLASGWMLLTAPIGPLASWPWALRCAQPLLGPVGIVFTLMLKSLPYVFLAVQASLQSSAAAPQEAARVLGLSRGRRLLLAAAALLPALAAGLAAAFAEAISDYAVAATLGAGSGFVMATYAIEQAVNGMPLDFPLAAASSLLLLTLVIPAMALQAGVARKSAGREHLGPRYRPAAPLTLSRTVGFAQMLAVAAFAAIALGVPLLAAISLAAGRANLGTLAGEFAHVLPAFGYSLELATVAATATVALAWPVATLVARGGRAGRVLDFALLGVLALPGIVLAASYVLMYNQSYTPLYGGSPLLAMAYVALALPAATKVLQGPVAQLHRGLGDAARVHGLSRLQALRSVDLPLLAQPLFSAWLLSVLHIAFELPASELLYPAGHPPLSVALLDAVSALQLHTQARLQLIGMALLVLFALLSRGAFTRLRGAPRPAAEEVCPS